MSCDVGEVTKRLENELFYDYKYELCSFSNLPVTSQLIPQPFRCFTYATDHSRTLLSLLLRHRIFTYVTWRAAPEGCVQILRLKYQLSTSHASMIFTDYSQKIIHLINRRIINHLFHHNHVHINISLIKSALNLILIIPNNSGGIHILKGYLLC